MLAAQRRQKLPRRRGAATIEFACAAPFLFAILLGMIDVETEVTAYFANRFPSLSDSELASALDLDVLDSAGNVLTGAALESIDTGICDTVRVTLRRDGDANPRTQLFFARAIGFGEASIAATATAALQKASGLKPGSDMLPFGVPLAEWEDLDDGDLYAQSDLNDDVNVIEGAFTSPVLLE